MTATVVLQLPVVDVPSGKVTTPTRTVPTGFVHVVVQLTGATTGNPATPFQGIAHPFSDPAMEITFGLEYSWDGGVTFPESVQSTLHGSPTGQWPWKTTTMTPQVLLSLVSNINFGGTATSYRAYASVTGGPITTGLTVIETTTP